MSSLLDALSKQARSLAIEERAQLADGGATVGFDDGHRAAALSAHLRVTRRLQLHNGEMPEMAMPEKRWCTTLLALDGPKRRMEWTSPNFELSKNPR